MILMIDNYDSFTYNLVQYLGELGEEVRVFRNDEITVAAITSLSPAAIVLSPGPCTPNEAGISMQVVREFAGKLPLLGICLGHQSIAQELGGDIIRARQVMHGKTSDIFHNSEGVFNGLPNPFRATRYHSLIVDEATLPESLEITAWTELNGKRDEIMAIRHNDHSLVQFHPESILTEHGHALLMNFLQYKQKRS